MREKGAAVLISYKMQSNGTEAKVKLFPGGEIYIGKTYAGNYIIHRPDGRRYGAPRTWMISGRRCRKEDSMKQLLQEEEDVIQKLGTVDQAMKRYSLGKASMRETGGKAGAIVRIGGKVLFNFTILDRYMDSLSGGYWDGK